MSWSTFLDPLGLFKTKYDKAPLPESFDKPATADEGGYIAVLWGTRRIKSMNFTYFGDVEQVAIKSKTGKKG